jgi:NB-ARC domain
VDKVCGKLIRHPRIIISGLPGVGKTELVRQVIKKAIKEKKYKGIFWLSAGTEKIFQAEIYALARALDLPEDPNMNIEMASERVLEELNRRNNWLMVLDNVDDRTLIKGFLPDQGDTRHVLITSRYGGASFMNGHVIRLEIMNVSEASILFANVYHCDDELEHHTQDGPAVAQLVTELGYLPLAIVQAIAYLYETQEDKSNYIRMYKETRRSIWNFKSAEGDYISVAAVMALVFDSSRRAGCHERSHRGSNNG